MAFRKFQFKIPQRLRRKRLTPDEKHQRDIVILQQTRKLRREVKDIPAPSVIEARIVRLRKRKATLAKRRRQAQTSGVLTTNKSVKLVQRSKAINTTKALNVNATALKLEQRLLKEARHAAPIKRAIGR